MEFLVRAQFIMGSILKIGIIENDSISIVAVDSAFKYANYLNSIWYKYYEGFEGNGDTIFLEEETDEILTLALNYLIITDSTFNIFYKSRNLYPVRISKRKWFFPKGLKIDLGGIVKGYVVDKIKEILLDFGLDTFYIDFGSSSIYSRNYNFELYSETFGEIKLYNKSLSISSSIRPIDNSYHIYNPKIGKVIKRKLDVLVIGENAVDCDVISTSIIVNPYLKEKFKNFHIEIVIH
ncbi:MAG: FAD:protein FMN transferase [candidate division WOR-3 bacterium]|nr:FAD:protein FMN transferase [candidate division WOR-3 bacterium]MCX7948064.1 FAD:protein FMN transferase [candidate division WOR-3 bacterium]MDW8150998.1 FAD:protein FMN transferase [candidate division WOR-3 bacterium]